MYNGFEYIYDTLNEDQNLTDFTFSEYFLKPTFKTQNVLKGIVRNTDYQLLGFFGHHLKTIVATKKDLKFIFMVSITPRCITGTQK